MRAVLALLLGLVSIAIADTDDSGEAFSWDSDEEGSASYNGLVVQAYNPDDGNPVVTLGTDLDSHAATYCLTLLRVFEATGYDLTVSTSTDSDYTEVSGSSVDLSDANCTISETSTTTFTIACNDINGATLTLAFTFVTNSDGDEGLEYTITLEDYTFTQDDAQLVLEQSVKDCSDLYEYSGDSAEESDEDTSTDDTDSIESTEEPETTEAEEDDTTTSDPIRRLLSDTEESTDDTDESTDDTEDTESDSLESEDGISSDDSDEYDVGYTQFIVNGQAYDDCESEGGEKSMINSTLVYNTEDEVLHIVFDNFVCTLFIDPYIGVDESKLTTADSGAAGVYVMIAGIIGFIGALLF